MTIGTVRCTWRVAERTVRAAGVFRRQRCEPFSRLVALAPMQFGHRRLSWPNTLDMDRGIGQTQRRPSRVRRPPRPLPNPVSLLRRLHTNRPPATVVDLPQLSPPRRQHSGVVHRCSLRRAPRRPTRPSSCHPPRAVVSHLPPPWNCRTSLRHHCWNSCRRECSTDSTRVEQVPVLSVLLLSA